MPSGCLMSSRREGDGVVVEVLDKETIKVATVYRAVDRAVHGLDHPNDRWRMGGRETEPMPSVASRECHGQPWGFPGQPAPVPASTGTGFGRYGCGFS
jgi:hypothetical protein